MLVGLALLETSAEFVRRCVARIVRDELERTCRFLELDGDDARAADGRSTQKKGQLRVPLAQGRAPGGSARPSAARAR